MSEWNTTYITEHPRALGGNPCLRGCRISVAQLLCEIAETSIFDVSQDLCIPEEKLRGMLKDLAQVFTLGQITKRFIG